MNKIQDYQPHQWEAEDFQRVDRNAKIDAALGDFSGRIWIAMGHYASDVSSYRTIDVGFAPKAVLVIMKDGTFYSVSSCYGGLAIMDTLASAGKTQTGVGYPLISLTSSEFTVLPSQ